MLKAMVVCSSSGVAIIGAHVVKLALVSLYCDHSSADQHPCPWHCARACVLMCLPPCVSPGRFLRLRVVFVVEFLVQSRFLEAAFGC